MSKDIYFIVMADGKRGPLSIDEVRLIWSTNSEVSVDTPYILCEKRGENDYVEKHTGYLGDIRDQIRPVNKEKSEEKLETKTERDLARMVKKERRLAQPTNTNPIEGELDFEMGSNWGGTSKKDREAQKKEKQKQAERLRRNILLLIVIIIVGYISFDTFVTPKLDGKFTPESNSITVIRNQTGVYVDDLIQIRDYLGVEPEIKAWDLSMIPNFDFSRDWIGTKVYMTQGSDEFYGTLKYVDPSTAYIRLNGFRGLLYITTLDGWETFRYYGIEYRKR